MTFERTTDSRLISEMVKRAWDRPEMLCDGADPKSVHLPGNAQCFIGREASEAMALFVGFQQSPVCIDLHVCMTTECRGKRAIRAIEEFFLWLRANTPYRKAIGSIPVYNRAMLMTAISAGVQILTINRKSTMRDGILEDQTIVERFLP